MMHGQKNIKFLIEFVELIGVRIFKNSL